MRRFFPPTSCLYIYVGLVLYPMVVMEFEMSEINAMKSSIILVLVSEIAVHFLY